jgi:hypothetical protein
MPAIAATNAGQPTDDWRIRLIRTILTFETNGENTQREF